ncbi:hypothetical protein PoB_004086300 [Plakobranchus ocellatus]|uniref:Uncharacterized protein n=1 Tax=Plakobranchus ocellatus TaxID=259542 RepID=A0AAV4B5J2_9GAST|nr:hypothetical protein PoB_004086300 [Plakobranchus ocellatus]
MRNEHLITKYNTTEQEKDRLHNELKHVEVRSTKQNKNYSFDLQQAYTISSRKGRMWERITLCPSVAQAHKYQGYRKLLKKKLNIHPGLSFVEDHYIVPSAIKLQ